MMEENSIRYIRNKLLVVSFLITHLMLKDMLALPVVNRVIFQTFELSEDGETVQCYGRCVKKSEIDLSEKVKVTRCDGKKMKFGCSSGSFIKINVATAGKLSPELDICNNEKRMKCALDITNKVQTICNGKQPCTLDFTKNRVKNKCGNVRHLALDIRYSCVIPTTTHVVNTHTDTALQTTQQNPSGSVSVPTHASITTATKMAKLTSKKIYSTSTVGHKSLMPVKPITSLITTLTTKQDNHTVMIAQSKRDKKDFWIALAYGAIMDSDYLKKNKTNFALILLLAMFLGMVLCLCICLDYCRRTRKKRNAKTNWSEVEIPDSQIDEYNERIELINSKNKDDVSKEPLSNQLLLTNDLKEQYTEEEGGVFVNMSVTTPFINQNKVPDQRRFMKTRSHANHPDDVLNESALPSLNVSSTSNEYELDNKLPNEVNTSGLLTRYSTDPSQCTRKVIPQGKCNSEMSEIEEVYVEEDCLNAECCEYEYVEVEGYHDCDGYSANTHLSVAYPESDNYAVPAKTKFASLNRRGTINDDTSNDEPMVRTLDSKRMRRSTQKDRLDIQKRNSLPNPKMRSYNANIINSSGASSHSSKHSRRSRVHVMPRCQELPASHKLNHKPTHSDNEVSRRRVQCEMEQQRSCKCNEHDISLNDLYCAKCGKVDESHLKCGSSLTSNCQSSHDEYSTDHGPLLSISNELIKNKQYCVEESGYQSHDTGTDSLCSSSFSTDHEDSRVFLPSSGHHCNCRCRPSRNHDHSSKRGPKLIIVPDQNKSINKTRRLRRETSDYVKCDNQTSVDVHSYDSSMDESSSRDSVRIFRRIRKQNMTDNDIEKIKKKCSCNCSSKHTEGRIDGIETS